MPADIGQVDLKVDPIVDLTVDLSLSAGVLQNPPTHPPPLWLRYTSEYILVSFSFAFLYANAVIQLIFILEAGREEVR